MDVTLEEYNAAIADNQALQEKITAIETAIGNVSTALSNVKTGIEDSGHSYDWIISNVDIYWNVEGAEGVETAKREMVGDLEKLRNDFASGGNFYGDVGDVIGKANDKIQELQDQMTANNSIINAYETAQAQAAEAEQAAAEEENNPSDGETSDEDEE